MVFKSLKLWETIISTCSMHLLKNWVLSLEQKKYMSVCPEL